MISLIKSINSFLLILKNLLASFLISSLILYDDSKSTLALSIDKNFAPTPILAFIPKFSSDLSEFVEDYSSNPSFTSSSF